MYAVENFLKKYVESQPLSDDAINKVWEDREKFQNQRNMDNLIRLTNNSRIARSTP